MFDFANSPTIGQTVSNGGISYIWDGAKWVATPNSGGDFVNVSGDTMTGPLVLSGDPTASAQAANKHYIDNAISLAGNYLGTWSVASNTPSITAGGSVSNANYVAVTVNPATPETAPGGIPGIAGQTVNNGDRIIWAAGIAQWQILRSPSPNVSSFNTRTGAVTLSSGDVTTVLPPSSTTPVMDGTATIGVGTTWARADHVHPTDTSRASVASVTAGAAVAANNAGRNLVHNALFNIAQRGVGPFTATGAQTIYSADRWVVQSGVAGDTMGLTLNPTTDADRTAIGNESATTMASLTIVGTATAGSMCRVVQKLEGVRQLSGKTITVSFWAVGSAANKLGISFDQFFGTGGSPSASVTGNGTAVTLTTSWARYSVTLAVPSASGKTLGTNGDASSSLNIWASAGSTFAAASGGIGNQGSWFANLWGVQLEIGSVATPLDYGGSPQQQLAACQRFYQVGTAGAWANGTAGSAIGHITQLPVTMRAVPTMGVVSPNYVNTSGASVVAFGGSGSFQAIALITATGFGSFYCNYTASADL